MIKEAALADLYNLTASDPGATKPLIRSSDKKVEEPPLRLTSEQQVTVLGLLRFRILSPNHFKTVFGVDIKDKETDFDDTKKEVPFIGSIYHGKESQITRLAPAFSRLDELYHQIKDAKKQLSDADKKKGALHFRRAV